MSFQVTEKNLVDTKYDRRDNFSHCLAVYLHRPDMEIEGKTSPVSCDRMTRGIKRLLEQGELLSSQRKKAEGQVNVEVRRCGGKKYVRVFRSQNKDNESKQNHEESDGVRNPDERIVEKKPNFAGEELNSFSALLLNILCQIRDKCMSSPEKKTNTLHSDGGVGMAL